MWLPYPDPDGLYRWADYPDGGCGIPARKPPWAPVGWKQALEEYGYPPPTSRTKQGDPVINRPYPPPLLSGD